jgi:hypothetical protein
MFSMWLKVSGAIMTWRKKGNADDAGHKAAVRAAPAR